MSKKNNKLVVPEVEQSFDKAKYEIAQEFGVHLNDEAVSREDEKKGIEITNRLINEAYSQSSKRFD